ncbi:MAG TPA: S8 family serine peptidase [Gammaproteobacteria bacterium]|nr:S8 family serine peptidase [Gammaproteobacteria bacterium]
MRLLSVATVVAAFCVAGATLAQTGSVSTPARADLHAHRIMGPVAHVGHADATARYIVRFKDAPAALYTGGIEGFKATSPHVTGGRQLDARSSPVRAYVGYLESRHTEFLKQADSVLHRTLEPHFQYQYALNGMSVSLNRVEAAKLARMANVISVQPVRYYRPQTATAIPASAADTYYSRSWIGAPTVWADKTYSNLDNEGEGIVVADVDTGINSGNSSFAAVGPKDGFPTTDPLGSGKYLGVCDSSNASDGTLADAADYPQTYQSKFHCNDKLIGAYTYTKGENDRKSPEDSEGHGSHTASTMVGNFVDVTLSTLGITVPISGVAPHANIIAYDVCDPTDLCGSDGSVAAVEQAIKDQSTIKAAAGSAFKGMVMNYSIGGGEDPYNDPVELAFLSAVEAGIYVSTSGGNGGPGNAILGDPTQLYSVEHWGPWLASTAASTHDGVFGNNNVSGFTGGDSTTLSSVPDPITGEGATAALASTSIVYAGDTDYDYSPYPGTFSTSGVYTQSGENYPDPSGFSAHQAAAECLYPFPASTFPAGSIVVCDRGDIPLVDKADNVKQGGAGGIIIVSQSGSALISEPYEIPGTMIANSDGVLLEAWLTNATTMADKGTGSAAMAQIDGTGLTSDPSEADQIADFSSRGPTETVFDDLVKPDLAAPGVNVLAAVSNPKYTDGVVGGADQPETYDFYDGTSMASPHDTAGGALLMQLHPQWTPSEIKSAMMLTAVTAANGTSPGLTDQCESLDSGDNCIAGTTVPSPQVRGAGRIDLDAASRSGIVLDETGAHYKAANPDNGGDLTTLNLASLANDDCIGSCSWTRTLSSGLSTVTATYNVTVSTPTGLTLTVTPSSFSLAPGATQKIKVTADVTGLTAAQWTFAEVDITSSDNGDDGQPIPAMHLPVSLERQLPEPVMTVSPTSLSFSLNQGQNLQSTLSIGNVTGTADLNWVFSTGNVTGASIWNQAVSSSGQGYGSGFFTPDQHGIYAADHFVMPASGSVSELVAEGFAQDGSSALDLASTATAIDWYIYKDGNGAPAGNPEDGKSDYVWHFSSTPTGPGVDTTNGTITLDLAAAGQAPPKLATGTYWLIVSPTINAGMTDPNGAAWYWFEGNSADGNSDAMEIDPSNAFGQGAGWQALQTSLAFTVTGTVNCSDSLAGLTLSAKSGKVKIGDTSKITASFDASAIKVGTYNIALCVTGDDPVTPLAAVPVSITVLEPPTNSGSGSSGGGGGGGGAGIAVLLGLGLISLMKRRS